MDELTRQTLEREADIWDMITRNITRKELEIVGHVGAPANVAKADRSSAEQLNLL